MLIDEGLELLTEDQCRSLLATGGVGRVGVTIGGLPAILPVNFAYVDNDIVFRTGEGTKLHAASRGSIIAFEIDDYDADERSGWSVLLVGHSSTVTDYDARVALDRRGLATWAGSERSSYVRLHPELITGRRIMTDVTFGPARARDSG